MTKAFQSLHPYDQSVIAEYPVMDGKTLEQRLESASMAFLAWNKTSFSQRTELLKLVAKQIGRAHVWTPVTL